MHNFPAMMSDEAAVQLFGFVLAVILDFWLQVLKQRRDEHQQHREPVIRARAPRHSVQSQRSSRRCAELQRLSDKKRPAAKRPMSGPGLRRTRPSTRPLNRRR